MNRLRFYLGMRFGQITDMLISMESTRPLTSGEYHYYQNQVERSLVENLTTPKFEEIQGGFDLLDLTAAGYPLPEVAIIDPNDIGDDVDAELAEFEGLEL